ncbi:hypothetical protein KV708_15775 [Comamonas thiooxydans]|uniref:hypothetical protein n=1 Tax=Comamonas thiooxydans TaxID=363952 RepID=UPI000B0E77D5|nr:hypothetical protein [Comamonas thiooxydans]
MHHLVKDGCLPLVIGLALPMTEADYHRPPLGWIKRRARRLMRAYSINRRYAIACAADDYSDFTHMHRERLSQLLKGELQHA